MNMNHLYLRHRRLGTVAAVLAVVAAAYAWYAPLVSAETLPVISNVAATNVDASSAMIIWATDVPASSLVLYGTTTAYGNESPFVNATATSSHSVLIEDLFENTLYHYQVSSGNAMGTTTSSDNTFMTALSTTATTTAATSSDTTAATATSTTAATTSAVLAVTGIDTVNATAFADNTFANGLKWILHLTVPDAEDAFRMKFGDFTSADSSGTIPAASNIRIFSPQSSNAASAGAAITQMSNDFGDWMYFTADASATIPGRQVDVTVEMRIPVGASAGMYTTTFGAQSVASAATSTTP